MDEFEYVIPLQVALRRDIPIASQAQAQALCAAIEEALSDRFDEADYRFIALSPHAGTLRSLTTDRRKAS